MCSFRLVAHIVDFVVTSRKRERLIVLDVVLRRVIRSGVNVNSMPALKIIMWNTVEYVQSFPVISLSTSMIQNTDRGVHSHGLDS